MRANIIKHCLYVAAETLAEVGEMPAGHLYAALMTAGINLAEYQIVERGLTEVLKVKKSGHLLTWTAESAAEMARLKAEAKARAV